MNDVDLDELERRAKHATPGDEAAHLSLDAIPALITEVRQLRAELKRIADPFLPRDSRESLSNDDMKAILARWGTGPERYQADADALIAEVLRMREEIEVRPELRAERDAVRAQVTRMKAAGDAMATAYGGFVGTQGDSIAAWREASR